MIGKWVTASLACLALLFVYSFAVAQDHKAHEPARDGRMLLDFPETMRAHMLSNMRGHLEALSAILASLSAGDGVEAARIARERLGTESPGAGACAPNHHKAVSTREDMAAMMAQHQAELMPEKMKALGNAMHEAANDFASEAATFKPRDDMTKPLASLSRVVQNCAACHASYRLQ